MPPDNCEKSNRCTVPPDIGVARRTRRKVWRKKQVQEKGVEPTGQNGVILRSSLAMKEMFKKGWLLRRTVAPTPPTGFGAEHTNLQPLKKLKTNQEECKIDEKVLCESRISSCQDSKSTKKFEKPKQDPKISKFPKISLI